MKLTTQNVLLDVISIGGAMMGSLLIAANHPTISKWGFVFFMVGAVASAILMFRSNVRRSQILITFWFMGTNIFGIIRWFNLI